VTKQTLLLACGRSAGTPLGLLVVLSVEGAIVAI
jgi:hypothetical protein